MLFIYRHDDASDNRTPDCTRRFEWEAAYFKKSNANRAKVTLIC